MLQTTVTTVGVTDSIADAGNKIKLFTILHVLLITNRKINRLSDASWSDSHRVLATWNS